ncbi:hypothetical protein [Nonomuraea sp. NEAU-A123]|uniref:hypothetical protein n=1 Tax=Nonomuraea sp. NEAU-A123 TaxID=2839649 RepID=UPI001BE4CC8A|nr:hypothetical protein [Nonomuraea sp. NEAU-A123]MBT2229841.1 hypothetical protein [Nonomuraea sp. NEAU-A123]
MPNGARHALGVVAGLLLPPLIAVGLFYGVDQVSRNYQQFMVSWVGLGVLLVSGVLLTFLLSSRLSPVASLVGGLEFTAFGVLPFLDIIGLHLIPDRLFGDVLWSGFLTVAYTGLLLMFGVMLLVSSAFPSRWRTTPRAVPAGPVYGVIPPYQGPEDATRPIHRD